MAKPYDEMSLREKCEVASRQEKENPPTKKKKSAADIEALRWREMFQAALTGFASRTFPNSMQAQTVIESATQCADLGLREFYARYEREK